MMMWKQIILHASFFFSLRNVSSLQDWTQKGSLIEPQSGTFDHAIDDYIYCVGEGGDNHLSMSHDGSTLAVGYAIYGDFRCYYDTSAVEIYHFDESTKDWNIRGSPIIEQGSVTSLSKDGNVVGIGKWNDDGGSVSIYEYDNNAWSLLDRIENDFDGTFEDKYFGYSIALSPDGSNIVVGHPGKFFSTSYYTDDDWAEEAPGVTYVYEKFEQSGKYIQRGNPIHGDFAANSGYRVAFSGDGDTVAILGTGYARVYTWSVNVEDWIQLGSDIGGSFAWVSFSLTGLWLVLEKINSREKTEVYTVIYDDNNSEWEWKALDDTQFVQFGSEDEFVKYRDVNFRISKRGFSVSSNGRNVAQSEGDATRVFSLDKIDDDDQPPTSVKVTKSPRASKSGKKKSEKYNKVSKSPKGPKGGQGKGGMKSSKMPKGSKSNKAKGGTKSSK